MQSQSTSCASAISQAAAAAAFAGDQSCLTPMVSAFHERAQYVFERLNQFRDVHCLAGEGAFYAFPHVEGVIARLGLKDDIALASYILEKAQVALVPGSAFMSPGFLRLSFATEKAVLAEALDRIEDLFSNA